MEKFCGAEIVRWYGTFDSEGKNRLLVAKMKIRREWRVKVRRNYTYTQGQTKIIVERRADSVRASQKGVKVRADSPWIGINDKWER